MGRGPARVAVAILILGNSLTGGLAWGSEAEAPVRLPIATVRERTQTDVVTVQKGDNLWKISARHLETRFQRPPKGPEVSPYWRRVIADNRESIRSGDPDLIYAGEKISMPVISEQP